MSLGSNLSGTQTNACLLGIPPELRLMIYSFLRPETVYQRLHVDADIVDLHRREIETTALAYLSRTCKLIHFEAKEVLYRNLCVDILADPHPPPPRSESRDRVCKQLSCFPEHVVHEVRSVLLRVVMNTDTEIEKFLSFFNWAENFLRDLKNSQKLQEFGFEVMVRRSRWQEEPAGADDGHDTKDREIDRARREIARLRRRFERDKKLDHPLIMFS